MAIATGHCFNDGKKRTAYQTMVVSLALNGVHLHLGPEEIGPRIIALAQSRLEGEDLADWLRSQAE